MPTVDPVLLQQPVSDEDPCGPDLEMAGNSAYLNVIARVEGLLPDSFFSQDFDAKTIDLEAETAALLALMNRSRDLRPLVLLAKLSILTRDLRRFVDCVEAVERLLETYWAEVHPTIANGGAGLRTAVLQALDDMPTVILPLQYAPLIESRRAGSIAFRQHMVASGEVLARSGESGPDAATIETACLEVEVSDLILTRDILVRLDRAVGAIRLSAVRNAGSGDAPNLDRLTRLTGRMLSFVDEIVARRQPRSALPERADGRAAALSQTSAMPAGAATVASTSRVASTAEAAAALAAVIAYLEEREPSSPSLLLVRQARQLIGKGFVEIMRVLVPEAIKEAKIFVGGEQSIVFRFDQVPLAAEGPPALEGDEDLGEAKAITIVSRQDAQAVLDEVAAYYRLAEPSNPIPLLCERARSVSALDFSALLKEFMPKKK